MALRDDKETCYLTTKPSIRGSDYENEILKILEKQSRKAFKLGFL